MTEIAKIISDKVALFGKTPREINNGLCEEFARTVVAELDRIGLRGALVVDVCWFDADWDPDYRPWHAWIYLDRRWYDAEAPDGVDDWEQLSFFRLWREDGFVPSRRADEATWIAGVAEFNRRVLDGATRGAW